MGEFDLDLEDDEFSPAAEFTKPVDHDGDLEARKLLQMQLDRHSAEINALKHANDRLLEAVVDIKGQLDAIPAGVAYRKEYKRKCKTCGTPFTIYKKVGPRPKYCSEQCRPSIANRAKRTSFGQTTEQLLSKENTDG